MRLVMVMILFVSASIMTGCAPDRYAPHGRFQAEPFEKAKAQCIYDARREGNREAATPNSLFTTGWVIQQTFEACMNAKGWAVSN